jgi:ectoine hydroxylase-related dioxygenase (phytanoyl-CoA dioxygenase family)
LWNRDEGVARFTLAKRFARIAAELMGVEGVRLYHDVSINKEAGGGYTPWHQDAYYWPMDTPHTITMWMPLVDITHEMGGLNFASGSQHDGYLGEGISDDSQAFYDDVIASEVSPSSAMRSNEVFSKPVTQRFTTAGRCIPRPPTIATAPAGL